MKRIACAFTLLGFGLVGATVAAAPGYVDDSGKSIVRTSYGLCLHTSSWTKESAVAECEGGVAEAAPVEVAAVEIVVRKELKPIRLEADALFAFDSAELTDEGRARLDSAMGQIPKSAMQDKRITITGFTDRIGAEGYNQKLSEQRANAVHDYLVSKGMPDATIDARGLGEANPLVSCEGESGAALIKCLAPNRRTEIEFSAMEIIQVEEKVPAGK